MFGVKNGPFDIECVAQYTQNTRERLQKYLNYYTITSEHPFQENGF